MIGEKAGYSIKADHLDLYEKVSFWEVCRQDIRVSRN